MFGFGRREKYNGAVDTKLNNEYQISTRDNSLFPRAIAYLKLIDTAWTSKMSEDEAALYIAALYYLGILKHEHHELARELHARIQSVGTFGHDKGTISDRVWGAVSRDVQRATAEAKQPTAMDGVIRAIYGDHPPTRSADLERAITIAHEDIRLDLRQDRRHLLQKPRESFRQTAFGP